MQINFHPSSARPYPVPAKPNLGRLGHGMGTTAAAPGSAASIASVAASGAATTASLLGGISAMTTAAGTGGFLAGATVFGMAASAAIPLIGAAIVGLTTVGILIANQFKGCGQTCIDTTNIVNQVGPILQQNLDHYLSSPVHYASLRAAALNNYDTAWAAVVQACQQVGGQGGAGCISDRQQGACRIKNADGSCFNWFIAFRDPIANDPYVVPDPTVADLQSTTQSSWSQAIATIQSQNGSNSANWDQWSYYWQNSPGFPNAPYGFGVPGSIQPNIMAALLVDVDRSAIIPAETFVSKLQQVLNITVSELANTPIPPGTNFTYSPYSSSSPSATGSLFGNTDPAGGVMGVTVAGLPVPLLLAGGVVAFFLMDGGK